MSAGNFKVIHLNVQSISSKLESLELYLNVEKPDIFCVSEHHLHLLETTLIHFPGYELGSIYARSIKTRGGVAIFVKRGLEFKEINLTKYVSEIDCELAAVQIKELDLIVITVYRSPKGDYDNFIRLMDSLLFEIKFKNIFVCGDFNIDLSKNIHHGKEMQSREFLDLTASYGLHPTILEATRVTKTSSTIIDNIFTNLSKKDLKVCVQDPGISDHKSQVLITKYFSIQKQRVKTSYKKVRKYNDEGMDLFKKTLVTRDWQELVCSSVDVGDCFENFIRHVKGSFNLAFPLKNIRITSKVKKNWMTKGILISRQNLHNMAEVIKFSTNERHILYFKNYKRIYGKVLRAAKAQSNQNRIDHAAHKSKELWKIVKELEKGIESQKDDNKLLKLVLEDQTIVTDEEKMVENLNDFFVNVGARHGTSGKVDVAQMYCSSAVNNVGTFSFNPVTTKQLFDIIKSLPNKYTEGPDGLPCKIIKQAKEIFVEPLQFLINSSYEQCKVPKQLKETRVTCIQKKANSSEINDLRPISINSVMSKIFEKSAHNQMVNHLNAHKLLSERQHGYRHGKSTATAVQDLLNIIHGKIENNEKTVVLFLDLSKAFDCLSHEIILKKGETYGFRGKSHEWIKSYLNNREQYVEIRKSGLETVKSTHKNVKTGVPQGSVLGPLLFSLCINDLPNFISELAETVLYADDCAFVISAKDEISLEEKVVEVVRLTRHWFECNNLKVNLTKSFLMYVRTNHLTRNLWNLNLSDNLVKDLTVMNTVKFLGVFLDSHLSWNVQVDEVLLKLKKVSFLVRKLVNYCDLATLKTVYYSYFQSKLSYCVTSWSSMCNGNVKKLFVAQKEIVRIMTKNPPLTSCKNLFSKLEILTLPSLIILECCLGVKRTITIDDHVKKIHNYETRIRNNFKVTVNRTAREKSPLSFNRTLYNALPETILNRDSYVDFKRELSKYLKDKVFYSLEEFLSVAN